MKKITLLILTLMPSLVVIGQRSSWSQFRSPEITRHSSGVGLELSHVRGRLDIQDNRIGNTLFTVPTRITRAESKLDYQVIHHTAKTQSHKSISLDYTFRIKNQIELFTENLSGITARFDWEKRNYVSKSFFWQYGLQFDLGLAPEENQNGSWQSTHPFGLAKIPLGLGLGRQDIMQDAQVAHWLMKKLSEANNLKQPITDDQLLALTQLVSKQLNQRRLNRLAKKDLEMAEIINWLEQNDLITKGTVNPESIYAIMKYSWQPTRMMGSRLGLELNPVVGYSSEGSFSFYQEGLAVNSSPLSSSEWVAGILPTLRLAVAYPITWRWHVSLDYSLGVQLLWSDRQSSLEGHPNQLKIGVTYLQDLRTQFSFYARNSNHVLRTYKISNDGQAAGIEWKRLINPNLQIQAGYELQFQSQVLPAINNRSERLQFLPSTFRLGIKARLF
jgi:hypothetical protein